MLRCRLCRSVILADMLFNHPFTVQPVRHIHLLGGEEVGVAVGDVDALVSHAVRDGHGAESHVDQQAHMAVPLGYNNDKTGNPYGTRVLNNSGC